MNIIIKKMQIIRTRGNTFVTLNAFTLKQRYFRFTGQPFRIMAPNAVEWASLKEYRRADTKTVMHGKPLYFKNPT